MRYMMIVKASKDSEAGKMPSEELIGAMGAYNEQLAKAGSCSMRRVCRAVRRDRE